MSNKLGIFDTVLSYIAPSWVAKRQCILANQNELAEQEHRNQLYARMIESEMIKMEHPDTYGQRVGTNGRGSSPLTESVPPSMNPGMPWQFDLATMTIDQAWRQGFPFADPAVCDDAYIAHNDSYREQILKLCRTLSTNHPTAKGILNTGIAFICGGSAWTILPAPKVPEHFAPEVQPVSEKFIKNKEAALALLRGDKKAWEKLHEQNGLVEAGIDPLDLDPDPVNLQLPPVQLNYYGYVDLPEVLDIDLTRELRRRWKQYCKKGRIHPQLGWIQYWREKVKRKLRDGEVFTYYGVNPTTNSISPRFLDPLDIVTPDTAKACDRITRDGRTVPNQDTAGIRVDPADPVKILGYWWRQPGQDAPELLSAKLISHIKQGVDSDVRRGLPSIYCVRAFLRHLDTWYSQSLKHQKIQTMVAMIRQWKGTTKDAVQSWNAKNNLISKSYTVPTGNVRTWNSWETLPVVDVPESLNLTYTTPNGNFADSQILVRRILLAIATGVNMSEAMVASDGSNANYSSTRITQMIPLKSFEAEQAEWSDHSIEDYERWTRVEVSVGHIKSLTRIEDEAQLDCEVSPPRLPNFEAEMVISYAQAAQQGGQISMRRSRELIGEDPDEQQRQIDEETQKQAEAMGQQSMMAATMGGGGGEQYDEDGNSIAVSGKDKQGMEHDPSSGKFASKAETTKLELLRAAKLASMKGGGGNGYNPDGRDGSGS